jgi:hypothetical protein
MFMAVLGGVWILSAAYCALVLDAGSRSLIPYIV